MLYIAVDFMFSGGGSPPDHSADSSGDKDIVSFICDGVTLDGVPQLNFKAAT